MYENIGRKIKFFAAVFGYGGVIVSIIGGIVWTVILADNSYTDDYAFIGIVVGVIAAFLFWVGQFLIYGFGELIDQTTQINRKMTFSSSESDIAEKVAKLKEWRTKGLITEAEYIEKINSL